MENSGSQHAVRSAHEIPGDKPEREDEHNDEQQGEWRVGHARVRYGKNSSLKDVRTRAPKKALYF